MNIKLFCFFSLLSFCMCFYAHSAVSGLSNIKDPSQLINNELRRLDTLIQATEQSLEGQKKLKELIIQYQNIQDQFLNDTQNNDLLFQLVKSAYRALQSINENHLIHTFDPEFISELTTLSQIATKRGIPKPSG